MQPVCVCLATLLILTQCVSFGGTHSNQRYPPGVPRPNGMDPVPSNNNNNEDVKFHDPTEFQQNNPPKNQNQQEQQQQQQQEQQQQQQTPPNSGQNHHHQGQRHKFAGGRDGKLDINHEKEHMKEHLKEEYISLDTLDEPQLLAQYFRNFDLDKNGRVDGLELIKSLHKMNVEHGHEAENSNFLIDDELVEEMDIELKFYDMNDDGYITYVEFIRRHRERMDT